MHSRRTSITKETLHCPDIFWENRPIRSLRDRFNKLCLTLSAEFMKSKFVRRPSVLVTIISEPNARISVKFWLLLPLGYTLGHGKKWGRRYFRIFFVFVNIAPYGSKSFKTLLVLQIVAESFQTFPEFSSQ